MLKINLEQVARVYSGINGRCCCGCSGKYTTASKHREWAGKDRGYAVTDDEVSDRSVATIVRKIEQAPEQEVDGNMVCAVVGNRLYFAILVTP